MSGIYIHIPFCKQACHYCDFHFSTSMGKKEAMVDALCLELKLRKNEFKDEPVETIYFGGGTPSVLSSEEIDKLINTVFKNYKVIDNPEITLEANPDDLSEAQIVQLSKSKVNRLSIGVQSFFEEDLILMNRAHHAKEAKNCVELATKHFKNISIDLIYGMPNMTNERWGENIKTALSLKVPHISAYALTVEPKTALARFIDKGTVTPLDEGEVQKHFSTLIDMLEAEGFVHYEISNFGRPHFYSKNNTAYWLGKKYVGIGPSAHSYDGVSRGWNISNNAKYLKAIQIGELPIEFEILTKDDRYNEYMMTGLRTIWGVSLSRIESEFGPEYKEYAVLQAKKYIGEALLSIEGGIMLVTKKGKFLADGIASDLFMVKLG